MYNREMPSPDKNRSEKSSFLPGMFRGRPQLLTQALALSVSLAIHGGVISTLSENSTPQASDDRVPDEGEKEDIKNQLKIQLSKLIDEGIDLLEKGQQPDPDFYFRIDALKSIVDSEQSFKGFHSTKEVQKHVDQEVEDLDLLFNTRINELAETQDLQWTGSVEQDFPTLQKALYTDPKALFRGPSGEKTRYQKDHYRFSEELLTGLVNCQSSRATYFVLQAIYQKKGLDTQDLEHLKAIRWHQHVASAYANGEQVIQLQELNLKFPKLEGPLSPYSGKEGVVASQGVYLAIYLLQSGVNPEQSKRIEALYPLPLNEYMNVEIPSKIMPIEGGDPFKAADFSSSSDKGASGDKGGLEDEKIYDGKPFMTSLFFRRINRNGVSLLDEPAWMADDFLKEKVRDSLLLGISSVLNGQDIVEGQHYSPNVYRFLHIFSDDKKFQEDMKRIVMDSKNPVKNLWIFERNVSITDPLFMELLDLVSLRSDFEEEWRMVLKDPIVGYGEILRYKYLSQYFNSKGHHFNIESINQLIDSSGLGIRDTIFDMKNKTVAEKKHYFWMRRRSLTGFWCPLYWKSSVEIPVLFTLLLKRN